MAWLARVAVSSMSLLVGCAAIANIGDGSDDDADASAGAISTSGSTGTSGSSGGDGTSGNGSSGSRGSSGSSGPSGSSGTSGTSGDSGAAKDGAVIVPDAACPKKADGVACTTKTECCSGGCNQANACHSCKNNFEFCSPLDDAPCCRGSYCAINAASTCQTCLPGGTAPASGVGGGAKSCCSLQINSGTGKCN